MTFATVGSDEDLRRQLLASKVVSDEAVRAAEVGGRAFSEAGVAAGTAVTDFFREEIVESLYRIRRPGKGQFVFNVDVAPKYRSESTFDVEICVAEADRRAAEWADIESVIASIDQSLRIVPEAPHNEPVTLAPHTWRLVANFEGTTTVRALADRLGANRFRVAKDLAALVRGGLVEAVTSPEPARFEMPKPIVVPEPTYGYAPTPMVEETPEPSYEPASAEGEEMAPEATPEPVEPDYNRSWWNDAVEQQEEAPEAAATDEEETPAAGESFLDRVFSQLNENPEGQSGPSQTTGHGFLKRRRMSSVGLDE